MCTQEQDLLTKMNEYFDSTKLTIDKLKAELSTVKLQRDAYKEELVQLQEKNIDEKHIAYTVIHTSDNREGATTEVCIGVFSSKAKALQAIVDVSQRNEVDSNMFEVQEFNVGQPLHPGCKVYVTHLSEEAHCEVSTRIIGVQIVNIPHSIDVDANEEQDVYNVQYITDQYDSIYPLGF